MSYLKFDRVLLTNLEKSLSKEFLQTNMAGAYMSSSITDCNTRKYHGLLVVPAPEIDGGNHVLLSSLDETVIQHGAEFNLGIHRYRDNYFSPKGHKYIREFHIDGIPTTIYRIGGVVLKKERIIAQNENRIYIRYTLLEAHSPTTLRLKPFLAFRSVNELTFENSTANTHYSNVPNGVSFCLYENYPNLVMQTNAKSEFISEPNWYKGIEYYKEEERGYNFKEDLFAAGYFEMPIKKGEPIVFSAGILPTQSRLLKSNFEKELAKIDVSTDFYSCLKNAVKQFYVNVEAGRVGALRATPLQNNGDYYLLAGYPWFKPRARDSFISLAGATLAVDNIEMFEKIAGTAMKELEVFLKNKAPSNSPSGGEQEAPLRGVGGLAEISAPDVLLWFIWDIQQYAKAVSIEKAVEKYGKIALDIIEFIRKQNHPNLFLHDNGLLYSDGKTKPATWQNAVENNLPITSRTGYIVEFNALWYNALCFCAEIAETLGNENLNALLSYQSSTTGNSFVQKFWNGNYLYDFIDDDYCDKEVRPNMIFAVSLPYSPLDKKQQKAVVDFVTRELLTVKGLRSLSPKSGMYRPNYVGGMLERNRNYHNGPVWTWTIGAFAEAYLKIYKQNGISFLQRILSAFESELTELTVGTLSELYDGNPPFKGHGAMSFAPTVAEVLRAIKLVSSL
ncbi:MAG: amylo-alpha-1,6-glucosidase [Prevotellaceae bacterium]|jgi:predicted glycogen debranching enzyme|nr:amylo-alpha-1,6-glucosidase [Prevotellaceae bacterium]